MKRLWDIRITRWYTKLLYVLGALSINFAIGALLRGLGTPMLVASVLNSLVTIVSFLVGARLFRARGEPVPPRRAWWRMTARPRLSWVLGILFTYVVLSFALSPVLDPEGARPSQGVAVTIIDSIGFATLAYLYLNSAIRLRKLPALIREPKFQTPANLR
ncbi:hypothetical protein EV379_0733 [Microterricola gilva]|uniref:Uncharacterized protein n=1 Tax=Microterricola gilva TaxID=393267 RepID=A0A4Q8AJA1_9MICO|nr:hypothetical protein [Microterricola gilva]RZU64438.1 hypothetical protein EV379_0733 [Microterricola gilva]